MRRISDLNNNLAFCTSIVWIQSYEFLFINNMRQQRLISLVAYLYAKHSPVIRWKSFSQKNELLHFYITTETHNYSIFFFVKMNVELSRFLHLWIPNRKIWQSPFHKLISMIARFWNSRNIRDYEISQIKIPYITKFDKSQTFANKRFYKSENVIRRIQKHCLQMPL